MSDYSFMKSGQAMEQPEGTISLEMLEEINILLSLFITRGLKHAQRYMKLSKRNVITKQDIGLGMKREIMTFINDPNLQTDFEKHKEIYLEEIYEEEEYITEEENTTKLILTDAQLQEEVSSWCRINQIEILKCNDEDKEFIRLMHNMSDHWEKWKPDNPFEKILQNNILRYF
jgi:histone H3/H4